MLIRRIVHRIPARALALVAGVCVAASCGSNPLSPYRASLQGSWTWVESTGGVAGQSYTPSSEGYTITYRFLANERVAALRDGQVRVNTGYTLEQSQEAGQPTEVLVHYGLPIDVFKFDPNLAVQRIARLHGDTLELADPCCDRYSHRFVRARS